MIKPHAIILIISSIVGFSGHWYECGVPRLSPWIPACIAIFILILDKGPRFYKNRIAVLGIILAFGLLTTIMAYNFLPDATQALRKKILFSAMSCSAIITLIRALTVKQ